MTSRPRVSIGMPVRNSRLDWFQAALDSLLAQDMSDFEIIISDNSSDPLQANAYREASKRDSRIRCIRHEVEISPAENFLFTARESRGEFFFWAADDDLRSPSFIRRTLSLLEINPDAAIASCQTAYIDEMGNRVGAVPIHPAMAHPSVRCRIAALASPGFYMDIYGLYRLSVLRKIDHIRLGAWGSDHVLVFKMLLHGPIPRVPEELFSYRVRSNRAESLVAFLIQENASDTDDRFDWESGRSRDIMNALLKSDLSGWDKLACLPRVASMLRKSPFVDERVRLMRYRYGRAIAERNYVAALNAAVRYAALSPSAVLRPSAWRLAYDQWRGRASP